MSAMRIEYDRAAVERLMKGPEVKAECLKRAEEAARTVAGLVPSRDRGNVVTGTTDDGAAFGLDSSFWHWWEFGNRYVPARAPLRSGAEAAGLRLEGR